MTDEQLLTAISSMMDEKLEPIKADVAGLKQDVAGLKQDVAGLKQEMISVKDRVTALEQQYRNIQMLLEHEIIPQLREIQTCYTSTYRRYVSGVDQIDTLQRDMDVLKAVVEDHSRKLQIIMCS